MTQYRIVLDITDATGLASEYRGATITALVTFRPGKLVDLTVEKLVKAGGTTVVEKIMGTKVTGQTVRGIKYISTAQPVGGNLLTIKGAAGGAAYLITGMHRGDTITELIADVSHPLTSITATGSGQLVQGGSVNPPALSEPVLFLSLAYSWKRALDTGALAAELNAIEEIASKYGCAGRLGVIFEGGGADGRPGEAQPADWRETVRQHDAVLPEAVRMAADRGIPVHYYRINSNNAAKGWKNSWSKTTTANAKAFFVAQTKALISALLPLKDWLTVNWCNEDDAGMDATIRNAIRSEGKAWSDRSSSPNASGVRWRESHPSKYTTNASGDRNTLVVTDNGEVIRSLFDGGLWNSGAPRVDKCGQMAAAFLAKGQRFGLYETDATANIVRHRARFEQIVAMCAKHIQAAEYSHAPSIIGDIAPYEVAWLTSKGSSYSMAKTTIALSGVRISRNRCYFKATPSIPWPKSGSKNVDAVGILIRKLGDKYVGGKCEWCVGTRGWFDCRTNVEQGYNGHTLPASGEMVWVGIGHPKNGSEVSQLVGTRWP